MKTSVLFNIGHVVAGIVVGYLVHHFSGEKDYVIGLLSIVTGLVTIITLEVIFHPYIQHKEMKQMMERINFLAEKVSDRLITTSDFAGILKYGHVKIPSDRVTDVWLDRIWQTHHRYWGVLYVHPKEVTGTTVFQLGLAVLAAKVRVEQVDVKRVFLVETEEDLNNSREGMQMCLQHNIQVRYLFLKQIESNPLLRDRTSHMPTLDFTLYDSGITWLLIVDRNRHIQHGQLFFDEKMNEQYAEVFRQIWESAKPFHS